MRHPSETVTWPAHAPPVSDGVDVALPAHSRAHSVGANVLDSYPTLEQVPPGLLLGALAITVRRNKPSAMRSTSAVMRPPSGQSLMSSPGRGIPRRPRRCLLAVASRAVMGRPRAEEAIVLRSDESESRRRLRR